MNSGHDAQSEPYVLVEGPRWGNAAFYGSWLLAAAEADRLFQQAVTTDAIFARQIDTLGRRLDFGVCATLLVGVLGRSADCALFPLDSFEAEVVAIMVGMGFFAVTGRRIQIVIPPSLCTQTVKDALIKVVQAQDDELLLHTEQLLATMPRCEAQDWQRRLGAMNENHRIADRYALLEDSSPVQTMRGPNQGTGTSSA